MSLSSDMEHRIREAVQIERDRAAFIAEFAVIDEHNVEKQYVIEIRKQIAQLIEGKQPKQDAA